MTLSKSFLALSILGALTTSAPAWADIPPDDECFAAMVGKACSNAMNDGKSFQPGVCSEAMCTRATPNGSMTYACYRCEPTEPGTGGQPNEPGAGGQSGSSQISDDPKPDSEAGGCSVTQTRGGAGALGLAFAVLGFTVAGWRRRRSLPS
jgi:hypothetical protein